MPEKIGLRGIAREGLDYEFTTLLELDLKHNAKATKDRTGLFMNKPEFKVGLVTGEQLKQWCETGTSVEEVKKQINKCWNLIDLQQLYLRYPDFQKELDVAFKRRKAVIKQEQSTSIKQNLSENEHPDRNEHRQTRND